MEEATFDWRSVATGESEMNNPPSTGVAYVRYKNPLTPLALCAQAGHEDVMLSFRDITAGTIFHLADTVQSLHQAGVGLEVGGEMDKADNG
jgi:hypothetical protein